MGQELGEVRSSRLDQEFAEMLEFLGAAVACALGAVFPERDDAGEVRRLELRRRGVAGGRRELARDDGLVRFLLVAPGVDFAEIADRPERRRFFAAVFRRCSSWYFMACCLVGNAFLWRLPVSSSQSAYHWPYLWSKRTPWGHRVGRQAWLGRLDSNQHHPH